MSALDVSIQSQILNLLIDLQQEFKLSYLFIAHDLAVVKHISDRVAIMYLGKVVETADAEAIYRQPRHPYTQLADFRHPRAGPAPQGAAAVLTGDVPSPINPPSGCHFHPRCPEVMAQCSTDAPEMIAVDSDHYSACHLASKSQD